MNAIDDPQQLVTDLKPAMLDRLAEEGYYRRRDDDLARALAAGPGPAPAAGGRGLSSGHGRRWRALALSVTVTGAAAGLVAGAVVESGIAQNGTAGHAAGQHGTALPALKLTDAQRVLYRLSADAAAGTQPTGRYVALTEIDTSPGLNQKNLPKNLQRALAIMKKSPALHEHYLATLKAIKGMTAVVVIQRTSVIDSLTGNTWTYQHGSGVPGELPVAKHGSPTKAQFAAWPTSPTALRALLLTQGRQEVKDGVEVPGQTSDDLVFWQASDRLWYPLISPALRSALYKVLAATPGVVVKEGATDRIGRPAIEISRYNSVTKEDSATFEDPGTGAVLESLSDQGDSSVYRSITGYASLPANPYGG
jgi:hypothetical protein